MDLFDTDASPRRSAKERSYKERASTKTSEKKAQQHAAAKTEKSERVPEGLFAPTEQELHYLVALQFIPGLGIKRLGELVDQRSLFDSLVAGEADPRWLKKLNQPVKRALRNFLNAPEASVEWQAAERSLDWLRQRTAGIVLRSAPAYPAMLREIPDSPPWLYWHGNLELCHAACVAIVGARKCSSVGKSTAFNMAKALAEKGITVVSGLAYGIDAHAHAGALAANAATVAVLASGLDRAGPEGNLELATAIAERGCLLTEQVLGVPATPGYFPRRNRIVSGLSHGLTVVEAAEQSGSMITARLALEQNREVFAVPGSVSNPQARGCHRLIKEGATLVESAEDILLSLAGFSSHVLDLDRAIEGQTFSNDERTAALSEELRDVYQQVGDTPEAFEALADRCSCSLADLSAALLDLELLGYVVSEAGCYARSR